MARTAPAPATRNVGDGLTAAYMNANVRDAVNFLITMPLARIHQATGQSIANSTWTTISFDATDADSDSAHSNTVNNSRYTCQVTGYYRVNFVVAFANATNPIAAIGKNGTRIGGSGYAGSSNAGTAWGTAFSQDVVHLLVNDYVEGFVFQNSGGAITTSVTGEITPAMNVQWLYSA